MEFLDQIDHLDKTFLSQVTTEFPDHLTPHEKTVTHAYLVLSHAVIEEHLEQAFDEHIDRLLTWTGAEMVPLEVVRFAYSVGEWLPSKMDTSYPKRSLEGMISSKPVATEIARIIKRNHGVSPDNVKVLAKLTGLDWKSFDKHLSAEIEDLRTLASKRGEAGHLSPFTANAEGLSWQDYPDNVREWVENARDAVVAIREYLRSSFLNS